MSNPNFGIYAHLGAAASAKIQRERAEKTFVIKYCQYCQAPLLLRPADKVHNRKRHRFCDSKCSKLKYWKDWRKRNGRSGPRKFGKAVSIIAFSKIGEVNKQQINQHARKVYDSRFPGTNCELCKYNKCRQVAHINPIRNFGKEKLLLEVNTLNNLVGLCPNCHWEFDHGMIELAVIKEKVSNRSPRPNS